MDHHYLRQLDGLVCHWLKQHRLQALQRRVVKAQQPVLNHHRRTQGRRNGALLRQQPLGVAEGLRMSHDGAPCKPHEAHAGRK